MLALPPEKIDAVRARSDLVELARAQTKLRQQGRNHVGCCPFHNERTPSFSVHADKQLFYCFGCQRGGDVYAFVMQTDGVDFATAVRQLAERAGVELEALSPAEAQRRAAQKVAFACNAAVQAQLLRALWPERGGKAPATGPGAEHATQLQRYLTDRGIELPVARRFGLGFGGPPGTLLRALAAEGIDVACLREAGLVGEGGSEPLVSGRLTFPIVALGGQVVGFGARRLDDAPAPNGLPRPKYINSRDGVGFHKNEQLFGLAQAASSIRQRREALLVEGYFDVLALHQVGATHAVAALGTQLTQGHAQALQRLATTVTLLFDGDRAGLRASFKACQSLLAQGLQVQLVPLSPGDDPASLQQRGGRRALLRALAEPAPAAAYFIERAFAGARGGDIERRVRAAQALMPLIDSLPGGLEKTLYTARIAEQVGVEVRELEAHWQAARRKKPAGGGARGASGRGGAASASRPARGDGRPGGDGEHPNQPPPGWVGSGTSDAGHGEAPGPRGRRPQQSGPGHRTEPRPVTPPHELSAVRELLLFPQAFGRLDEVSSYFQAPELVTLLQSLANQENPEEALPRLLTQCISSPRERAVLAEVRPFVGKTLDEAPVRANRTLTDIVCQMKRRAVDDALQRVLGELARAEGRGDATEALLRRKQQLTAEKRALRRATS